MRAVLIVCVVAMAACSAAQAQPDKIESVTTSDAQALVDRNFWTEQRMQDARAMPLPVVDASGFGTSASPDEQIESVPSGKPKLRASGDARSSGDAATRPLYWSGKLFFALPQATATCSAQMIDPDVLVTAAHCVRLPEDGTWFTRFLYSHKHNRGKGRAFSVKCATTFKGWVGPEPSRHQWDYAMIKLTTRSTEGYFGLAWDWRGKYNQVPKIGYPGAIEGGEVVQVDFGRLGNGWAPSTVALNHGNPNSAEGSSGGAWVGQYETSGANVNANYVLTVSSHYRTNPGPGVIYGPYWNEKVLQLLQAAQRDCK